MKNKLYLLLSCCILFVCFSEKANAQKVHSVFFSDSCGLQTIYVSNDSITLAGSPLKLEISYGDGTKDTSTISWSSSMFKHNYSTAGTFTIKAVLITSSWSRLDSAITTGSHTCTYLDGWLYADNNSNCLLDAGDDTLSVSVPIEVDSSSIPIDTILGYRSFTYFTNSLTAKLYSFKVIPTFPGMTLTCPSGGSLTATSVPGSYKSAGNLGFTCSSSSLDVAVHPVTHAGRHSMMTTATLTSTSCSKTSGSFTITVDSRYKIAYLTPVGGIVSGNMVTWSYTGLSASASKYFSAESEVPSTWLIPGTTVVSVFHAPVTGDPDTTNNLVYVIDTVTSSWDPNDKQVSPKGNINPSTTLTYTLSFENTGNAAAKNIHILDTLASDLDANSMQIITSSHPVKIYKFKLNPRIAIINFDFPNINLPDSSHHGLCDGFVTFSIKTKGSLPIGTVVHNSAGIYFDDNDVVLTNTTSNKVVALSISSPKLASDVLIYPNPTGDDFTIKAPKGNYTEFEIINSIGQHIMQRSIQNEETHVNAKSLVPGIYFIMMKGSNGMNVERFEKK